MQQFMKNESIGFSVNYFGVYLNSINYENPVEIYQASLIQFLYYGVVKILNIDFSNNSFHSDDGWLLEEWRIIDYIKLDKYNRDFGVT